MLQPGDRIIDGRYQVQSLLAKGGMGQVYLVQDTKLQGKIWVVKEIDQASDSQEFAEEARMLTSLSHPYIPNMTDFESMPDGRCYLVMEYIQGMTLQQLFERASYQLPETTIVKYAKQLCEVLHYLHNREQPIVFRDLKPSNVMIDHFDNIRLIDFGIARHYTAGQMKDTVQLGTVAFAAPEQFEMVQTDPRTDIYALGAILYYLLSGGQYYYRTKHEEAFSKIPAAYRTLLRRMLAHDPSERYQHISEVADLLKSLQAPNPVYPNVTPVEDRTIILRPATPVRSHPDGTARIFSVTQAQTEQTTAYTKQATQSDPALIIYLLDVSGSMTMKLGERSRLDVVTESLYAALRQMVYRSTKGSRISPRYRVAILAYSDDVEDLLGGVKGIDELMTSGQMPVLRTQRFSDAAKAFLQAEALLQKELPSLQNAPAPLICHMTDGVYTGEDPLPIAQRIMNMKVNDGHVLIENIFISDDVLEEDVTNPKRWSGVLDDTLFKDEYGNKLRKMSSVIPESYRQMMLESNYQLAEGAYMMLPGMNSEMVSLGFQMSAATPVR